MPGPQRHRLAEVFAQALVDRDPQALPEQIAQARDKAHRAPLLMLAVACLGPREPDTPMLERMVSMGAAIQNLLLGAHAMGFGAGLTSSGRTARHRGSCRHGTSSNHPCRLRGGADARRYECPQTPQPQR